MSGISDSRSLPASEQLLNLGCGLRFHPRWVNADVRAVNHEVLKVDLRKPLPFESDTFSVVYHSHVLEHLRQSEARQCLEECWRVLIPGGILRVAVPDLQQIAQAYLNATKEAEQESPETAARHEWMTIELIDQMVRERGGGELVPFIQNNALARHFIIQRIGSEAHRVIMRSSHAQDSSKTCINRRSHRITDRISSLFSVAAWKWRFLRLLLPGDMAALNTGLFRHQGEVHQWMYDRHSLRRVLLAVGFIDVVPRTATESYVKEWGSFNLDTESSGAVYKPDSLFMEGRKPQLG